MSARSNFNVRFGWKADIPIGSGASYVAAMKLLDSSMLGLRSGRKIFRSPRSSVSFTLFPMVHVGEKAFYQEVFDEAFNHDVTLVEVIRSPIGRQLTRSYRWINFKRLCLVLQPPTPEPGSVSSKIVNADLSADEFHEEWRKIPMVMRALIFIISPVIGLQRRFFASRASLARRQALNVLRSSDEILGWSPTLEPLYQSVLHARDERLIECISAEAEAPASPEKRVAIVYGAQHMRAVIRSLTRRGYHCSDSSWLTIISA